MTAPVPDFRLEISHTDGAARRGRLQTAHGVIDTPAFMPVGTAATVKAMRFESVAETGAQIVLGNTYHLMLRPGSDRIERLGGLRAFMGWGGPVLTDSGGFQVMSLATLRKMSEDGVTFKSHIDGSAHHLSPERSMQIQHELGSTITMAFDECTPYPAEKPEVQASMELSMRWARRSKEAFIPRPGHALFGIVQGGVHEDLRARSIGALTGIGFDGYAIGGLAVGEGQELMFSTLDVTTPRMPVDKPRYLMGVGKPDDLVGAVLRGVDMFDCVLPSRSGRTGQAFTARGAVNLRNARHRDDPRPLEEGCDCPACHRPDGTAPSRAYLHHLVRAEEILGLMLLTWHNLRYYQRLMAGLRAAIETATLKDFADDFARQQQQGDIPAL